MLDERSRVPGHNEFRALDRCICDRASLLAGFVLRRGVAVDAGKGLVEPWRSLRAGEVCHGHHGGDSAGTAAAHLAQAQRQADVPLLAVRAEGFFLSANCLFPE